MSRGPEQELAAQLTTALNAWLDTNIPELNAVRVYRIEHLSQFVRDDEAQKVAVIASSNESETGGRSKAETDLFEVLLTVVVVAKLPNLQLATVDAWDLKTTQIRSFLTSQHSVAAAPYTFIRRKTSRPVLYDVEAIDKHELWFSVIETVYRA